MAQVKVKSYSTKFREPETKPFGAHKWIRFGGEKIPNKGYLVEHTIVYEIDGKEVAVTKTC